MKKKVYIEEYEDLGKLLEVCNKKRNGEIHCTWDEVADLLGIDCAGATLNRFTKYINIYQEWMIENDKSIVDIDSKLLDLKIAKREVQNERRDVNARIRELADFKQLRDMLFERVSKLDPLASAEPNIVYTPKRRTGALMISDLHYGQEFDDGIHVYSPQICKERMDIVLSETLDACQLFRLERLVVVLDGDLVSGIIHRTLRITNQKNIIDQVKDVAEILCTIVASLCKVLPITIVSSVGNHGRVIANYKESIEAENFEKLLPWYMEARLQNFIEPNDISKGIEFIDDGVLNTNVLDIYGKTIVTMHGHQSKPKDAYQWCTKELKIIPDYILYAHLHCDMRFDDGCPVIVNGMVSGCDEHSVKGGYTSVAHQKLVIFDERCGEICTQKIVLE